MDIIRKQSTVITAKADEEMIFDKTIHSSNVHILGIDIVSTKEHAMIMEDRKEMTIKQAHSILGYVNDVWHQFGVSICWEFYFT
jgi:activator of 2-hydroxyglutaryl-CoA dehydratase